jgi:hypothetical protein
MSPFIAIAAAIITFAAFVVQYTANQEMRNENKKQQIINRFYEMMQIHRDNIKDLEWINKIHYTKDNLPKDFIQDKKESKESDDKIVQKKGRKIFEYYIKEFNIIYKIIEILHPESDLKEKIKKTYNIFYRGDDDDKFSLQIRLDIKYALQSNNDILEFKKEIEHIIKKLSITEEEQDKVTNALLDLFIDRDYFEFADPFWGHFEEINVYYRHLFLIVKYIVTENENILFPNDKKELLQVLRAQLSVKEQVLLFYNWISGHGQKWEESTEEGNHFFTQYHMIHNILPGKFIPFYIKDQFTMESLKNFMNFIESNLPLKKFCSAKQPLFEFEEWNGYPRFKYD